MNRQRQWWEAESSIKSRKSEKKHKRTIKDEHGYAVTALKELQDKHLPTPLLLLFFSFVSSRPASSSFSRQLLFSFK